MNTLLSFLLTLAVLIAVHEWGHYRAAIACGVKVLRFSIGFGRPIWRRQRGETEWVIGLLPLGGYVRMLDEREGAVAPAERDRAFNTRPLAQRAFIVAAGPLANLVLAVLLYAASHWVGTEEPRALLGTPVAASPAERAGILPGDEVLRLALGEDERWHEVLSFTDLRWQLTRAALDGDDVRLLVRRDGDEHELRLGLAAISGSDADPALMRRIGLPGPHAEPVLGEISPGGAAERAGLLRGDRVLSVDGRAMPDAGALRATIRAAARAHDTPPVRVEPVAPVVAASAEAAQAASAASDAAEAPAPVEAVLPPGSQRWRIERGGQVVERIVTPAVVEDRGQRVGRIEAVVGAGVKTELVRLGPVDGLLRGVERSVEMATLSLKMLGRILIGEASTRNLSGPLTIAEFAGQSAQLGLAYYLGFLAVVSVSLGVLNLLPLPMLDGGHLLFYAIEAVLRRPLPEAWIERFQRGGLVVIVLMMSLALYNDVARLLGLF